MEATANLYRCDDSVDVPASSVMLSRRYHWLMYFIPAQILAAVSACLATFLYTHDCQHASDDVENVAPQKQTQRRPDGVVVFVIECSLK